MNAATRVVVIALLVAAAGLATAAPVEMWRTTFGTAGADQCYDVQAVPGGGWVMVGHVNPGGTSLSGRDLSIARIDTEGSILWQRNYGGGTSEERGFAVQPAPWGGFVACGFHEGGAADIGWVIKVDSSGTLLDSVDIAPSGGEVWLYDLAFVTDTSFVVVGEEDLGTDNDGIVALVDSALRVQWTVNVGGVEDEWLRAVRATSDGNIVVSGLTEVDSGNEELYIFKMDLAGNLIWDARDGDETNDDHLYGVVEASDGGFVGGGYMNLSTDGPPNRQYALMKTDSIGSVQWTRAYGGDGLDWGYDVGAHDNGQMEGYLGVGYGNSWGEDPGNTDAFIYFFDANGDSIWLSNYGGTEFDKATTVLGGDSATFVIGGYTRSFGAAHEDWMIVRFEDTNLPPTALDLISPSTLDTVEGPDVDFLWHPATDPDGENGDVTYTVQVDLAQHFTSPIAELATGADTTAALTLDDVDDGTMLFWRVLAVDGAGDTTASELIVPFILTLPSGVGEEGALPARFEIARAWPNPFNSSLHLELNLPEAGEVKVEAFDLLGRRVAQLARGSMAAGTHRLSWKAEVASGVYMIRATGPAGMQAVREVHLLR